MAKNYPRKQTVIIFMVCFILVLATLYYTSANKPQTANNSIQVVSDVATTSNKALNIDTANFTNWQKQFSNAPSKTATKTVSAEDQTQTTKLGHDLFTRYMELQQANLQDDSTAVSQTASSLIDSNLATPVKIYTIDNLTITNAQDLNSLIKFNALVNHALEIYSVAKNESAIVKNYVDSSDVTVLKGMDPIIADYKLIISTLLATPTPKVLSASMLELINAFSYLEAAAEDIKTMSSDSVRGLTGISTHINGANELINALKGISDTLKSFSITPEFDQNVLTTLIS